MKKIERRRRRERDSNCLEKKEEQKERPNYHHHASKAKTIKKTIKTEVKAIVHGQERVDKRGKPVTSIADRTNVRAAHKTFFFIIHIPYRFIGFVFEKRKKSIFVMAEMLLLCVCIFEKRHKHTKKSFSEFFRRLPPRVAKRPKKEEILFTTTTIIIIIIIIIVLTPRVFSFFLLFTGVRFGNLSLPKSTRNWKTRKRKRATTTFPAEGKTHANAAVSVRRRPGQPPRSGVRVRY